MAFPSRIVFCLVLCALTTACGDRIGDSCSSNSDCASEGGRLCDVSQPEGYCTVPGCDEGTCPSESECVQFFSVINLDKTCGASSDCSIDEICTVGHFCAARDSEVRFCMLNCSSSGDCRDKYECRDLDRMGAHGGQPVQSPDEPAFNPHPFCAAALPCERDNQCDFGDTCGSNGFCG